MSRSFIPAGLICLGLAVLAACIPEPIQAQTPPAVPRLSGDERAAKLAERDRLWKEAAELRAAGKLEDALDRLASANEAQRALYGDKSKGAARALGQIALNQRDLQHWSEARAAAAESLAICEKIYGLEDWHTVDARLRAADVERWSKFTDDQRAQLAEADRLLNEVRRLRDQGKYREGVPLAQQSLVLRRQVLGDDHRLTGDAWSWLGFLYNEVCDAENGEVSNGRALDIRKKVLGEIHPDYSTSLNNLAWLYRDMGEYARAEPLYKQSLEIKKKAQGIAHPEYALGLNNLALLYDILGEYARAEPLYLKALEIRKKTLGEADPFFAQSLDNLASLYSDMGDYARAEPLLKQALQIYKKARGEAHPDYATSLNSLASLYSSMGKYARAEPLFKQALEIYKKARGEAHPDYARVLDSLAVLYKNRDDCARAEPLYKQALEIRKRALGEAHPSYATSLNNLALLYYKMGDYAQAEPLFKQALGIYKKALGEPHPSYATSLANLGLLQLALGRPADAERLFRLAVQIQRKSLDLTAAVQSEQQQLTMVSQQRFYLDRYLTCALAASVAPSEIYAEVVAWKGSVSAQQQLLRVRQRALAKDPNSEVGRLFAQLDTQTRRLAALTRNTPKPEETAQAQRPIHALSESLDTLQQQLSRLDPDFHRAWAERQISPGELQRTLPAEAALVDLLEYSHYIPPAEKGKKATYEPRVVAFVLRRDEPVACVQLGASAPIGLMVGAWRVGYGRLPTSEGKLPEVELRRLLWEPLAPHLAGVDTVLVSPDGALAQLPWGALPGDAPGKLLIEERAIAVIAIPQMLPDLLAGEAGSGPPTSLLLAGDIDYGGDPGTATGGAGKRATAVGRMRDGHLLQFPKLNAAQAELASIDRRYRKRASAYKAATLDGSDATEAAFRDEAPKHLWLHLITHGFFSPDDFAVLSPSASPGMPADGQPALAGIGAVLEVKNGHYQVAKLIADGTAMKDGRLKVGDEVIAIAQANGDWTLAAGKELPSIVSLVRGPLGTTVRVRVRPHDKLDQELELALVRAALPTSVTTPQQIEPVNPGLLSGLAFAGANTPPAEGKDDGILTALEVSSLDLSKVDTVVLSACETGLGQVAGGEGLLGLQRSFQVAGAKTVVASLWKVPDAATSRLMQRFYENLWDKKMGKLAALREAQIWMIRDKGNRGLTLEQDQPADAGALPPFYWAAFVLSGDWR